MMLVGSYPYEDTDGTTDAVGKILMGQYVLPPDLRLTDSCKDIIQQMFDVNPHQRISIEGIKRHEWFTTPLPAAFEVWFGTMLDFMTLVEMEFFPPNAVL